MKKMSHTSDGSKTISAGNNKDSSSGGGGGGSSSSSSSNSNNTTLGSSNSNVNNLNNNTNCRMDPESSSSRVNHHHHHSTNLTTNLRLKKVLKSYQQCAPDSLSGPNYFNHSWINGDHNSKSSDDRYCKFKGINGGGDLKSSSITGGSGNSAAAAAAAAAAVAAAVAATTSSSLSSSNQLPPPLRIPPPIIIPADQNSCQRSETVLEGEVISCFIVGGEKRLCLPQILNTVLTEFSLQQINSVCDELHIFCSRCTPEQLEVLKVTGILPASAPSCGLITKTDAERLCAALLFYANRTKMLSGLPGIVDIDFKTGLPIKSENFGSGIPVCHKCFGQSSGTIYPDLYLEPSSRCIKCVECSTLLTPQRFVTHTHASTENRTCHWGFDSHNWRAYIHLDEESNDYLLGDVKSLQTELDSFKSRFDPTAIGLAFASSAAIKRKLFNHQVQKTQHHDKKDDFEKQTINSNEDQLVEPSKKIKTEDKAVQTSFPGLLSPYPYSYFPVSTNWTPDPSVFSYWYHPSLAAANHHPEDIFGRFQQLEHQ